MGNAQNLLVDDDFSTTTSIQVNPEGSPAGAWYGFVNSMNGVEAIPSVESGVCHYQITNGGQYLFEVQVMQVPVIKCPENISLPNESGVCGATVWNIDIVPVPNCGGDGFHPGS